MKRDLFVLLHVAYWADQEFAINLPLPVEFRGPPGTIGYLPVFETEAEAQACKADTNSKGAIMCVSVNTDA